MRKHILNEFIVMDETALAASLASNETVVEQLDSVRYTVEWANGNAPDMEIMLQYSNDNVNWYDLQMDAVPTINTASGEHTIDIDLIISKYLRLMITVTSGDADVSIKVKGTTTGA